MFAGFVRSLTALKVASIARYFFPIDMFVPRPGGFVGTRHSDSLVAHSPSITCGCSPRETSNELSWKHLHAIEISLEHLQFARLVVNLKSNDISPFAAGESPLPSGD